jgi:hypothetical protein
MTVDPSCRGAEGGGLSEEAVRPLLAAHWKMNPVRTSDAADLGRGVVDAARDAAQTVDVVLLPPFPWLLVVVELLGGTGVGLVQRVVNNLRFRWEGRMMSPWPIVPLSLSDSTTINGLR